jgi:hypothetical protein
MVVEIHINAQQSILLQGSTPASRGGHSKVTLNDKEEISV